MSASNHQALHSPLRVGAFRLEHRVVMPAMVRLRAGPQPGVPNELMRIYYAQRATYGGLLIAERSRVHANGHTDHREPGIYSPEQVNAWREVAGAVRERGGVLVAQLGIPVVEATAADAVDSALRQIRDAAESAGDAGFDGIEVLGAWPDAFSGDVNDLNERSDLLQDLLHTLGGVWPVDRIGLHLNAVTPSSLQRSANALEALRSSASVAGKMGVAFVHVNLPWPTELGVAPAWLLDSLTALRALEGPAPETIIASGGLTARTAGVLLDKGLAQAVGFGRSFITNQDLARRLRYGAPLEPWSDAYLHSTGSSHYVDFPVSNVYVGNIKSEPMTPEALRCDADPWNPGPR